MKTPHVPESPLTPRFVRRSLAAHRLAGLLGGCLLLGLAGCVQSGFEGIPEPLDIGPATTGTQELSASQNGLREITLRWPKPPPDTAYRYRIERAPAQDGPYKVQATVNPDDGTYTDRGTPEAPLADAAAYFYRLVALSKDGITGEPSVPVRGMTEPPPKPPRPIGIEAHKSRGVLLKWDAPISPAIVGYVVRRAPASAPADVKIVAPKVAGLAYEDGGTAASELRDSTDYLYSVAAINRVGAESEPAPFPKVTTRPPPKPVLGLTATSREVRCMPLAWKPSPEPDVVRYDVYRSGKKDGPFAKIAGVEGRETVQYLDGGRNPGNLEDGGTYYYRVRAVNVVTAESADSETVEGTTREEPPVVVNVQATPACPRRVPLAWPVSPDERVIGYEVWRAGDGQDFVQIATVAGREATAYVDHGAADNPAGLSALKDQCDYQYKIVAFNYGFVRSSASKAVTARTKKRPDTPVGLTATTNLPHAVDLAWKPNPEPDIVEYEIQVSDQPGGTFRKMDAVPPMPADTKVSRARESGLGNGVARYYRVKAVDRDRLESDWSDVVPGRSRPLPPAPAQLGAAPVLGGVRLAWEPVRDPPIREYAVWKKNLFNWTLLGRTGKPEFFFLDREIGSGIAVAVSAVDSMDLESPRSMVYDIGPAKK